MTRYNCSECGDPLIPTTDEGIGSCLNRQWGGDLDDAVPDTTSPLDVTTCSGEVSFDIETNKRCRTMRTSIRLSPDGARQDVEWPDEGIELAVDQPGMVNDDLRREFKVQQHREASDD
jgi:hypothetical protein